MKNFQRAGSPARFLFRVVSAFFARTAFLAWPTLLALAALSLNISTAQASGRHRESLSNSLVGRWERQGSEYVVVYLPDGRCASWDQRTYLSPADIHMETGHYKIEGDTLKATWTVSEPESFKIQVEGDTLTIQTSAFPIRFHRTDGAEGAAQTYDKVAGEVRRISEESEKSMRVGAIKPGTVSLIYVKPDTHASSVFDGAKVYTDSPRFNWILSPVHQYSRNKPDEPGFTCFSYTFLPNGRFTFDGWLYGILVDDALPFDERNPAEVRAREVTVKHQQFWGRYRVIPGHSATENDTVELLSDSGARQTFQVVNGRLFLIIPKPYFVLSNFRQAQKFYTQKAH